MIFNKNPCKAKRYLKPDEYLFWESISTDEAAASYFISFKHGPKTENVQVSKEVYQGMKELEGEIVYSDKKFVSNTTSACARSPCPNNKDPAENLIRGSPIEKIPWAEARGILKLRLGGLEVYEIAKELGISTSTVYRYIEKAKVFLGLSQKGEGVKGKIMKAKMNRGNMVRELRKSAGLTQEQLAEALSMSVRNLSNIENGRIEITLWNFITVLEMSGNNADDFWLAYIHSKDYQDYLKLRHIKRLLRDDRYDEARDYVEKFEQSGLVKNSYINQFIKVVKVATDKSLSLPDVVTACQEILRISRPDFCFKKYFEEKEPSPQNLRFNYNEVITICLAASTLFEMGSQAQAIQIMKNITHEDITLYCTQEDKRAIYPATLFTYSNMLGKSGHYKECLEICNRAIKLSIKYNNLCLMPAILYNKACALEKLSHPGDNIKAILLEAYYSARAIDRHEDARKIKEDAEQMFNIVLI
jgi:transcriptional regulator with XRE-family HTH domain